jgi:hypothetical protein
VRVARIRLIPSHSQKFAELSSFEKLHWISETPQSSRQMRTDASLDNYAREPFFTKPRQLISNFLRISMARALQKDVAGIIDYANSCCLDTNI